MFSAIARRVFGSANDRYVKSLHRYVAEINALEPELEKLDDAALAARTQQFRERLEKGETLVDLMVEAFATVREAAKRTLGQRHFDVQMIGGMVLHRGQIAEMKTGEGKTRGGRVGSIPMPSGGKAWTSTTATTNLARGAAGGRGA